MRANVKTEAVEKAPKVKAGKKETQIDIAGYL